LSKEMGLDQLLKAEEMIAERSTKKNGGSIPIDNSRKQLVQKVQDLPPAAALC